MVYQEGDENFCTAVYSAYPMRDYLPGVFGNVGIGGIVLGFVYFFSAAVTIVWIRQQQKNALRGMEGAAKHVIFPIYLPIMWASAFADCLVGLVIFLIDLQHAQGHNSWIGVVCIATTFAVQHFTLEGTALLLMQPGCGLRAVRRAASLAALWAVVTFGAIVCTYWRFGGLAVGLLVFAGWNLLLLAFYGTLCFASRRLIFRRPAVIFYARFWVLYLSLVVVSVLLEALGGTWSGSGDPTLAGDCIYFLGTIPMFVTCKVWVLYYTLLMDSRWWQGLGGTGAGGDGSAGGAVAHRNSRSSRASGKGGTDSRKRGGVLLRWLGLRTSRREESGKLERDVAVGWDSDVAAALISDADTEGGESGEGGGEGEDGLLPAYSYRISADGEGHYVDSGKEATGPGRGAGGGGRAGGRAGAAGDGAGSKGMSRDGNRAGSGAGMGRQQGGRDHIGSGAGGGGRGGRQGGFFSWMQRRIREYGEQLRGPLSGVEVGFSEAQELAREVDNIRGQGAVKLLNFAYLSLNSAPTGVGGGSGSGGQVLLGAGSFSKVYAGSYRGAPVAVKMLFTQDLNPEVIRRCSTEARILAEVGPHPNVVEIFGVAVLPPSVCLVLEICEFGSLADVLRGSINYNPNPSSSSSGSSSSSTSSSAGAGGAGPLGRGRPPLSLSYADRLYLALGCARGLEALHAYSPTLCHRDIKSFNFLIDSQLNAKIADLDLGQRSPKRSSELEAKPTTAAATTAGVGVGAGVGSSAWNGSGSEDGSGAMHEADSSAGGGSSRSSSTAATADSPAPWASALSAAFLQHEQRDLQQIREEASGDIESSTAAMLSTANTSSAAAAAAALRTDGAAGVTELNPVVGQGAADREGGNRVEGMAQRAPSKSRSKSRSRRKAKARPMEWGDRTVGGSNMCIYWQAPEVLRGEEYTQAADVHSLALVLWEVFSAARKVKYVSTPGSASASSSSSGPSPAPSPGRRAVAAIAGVAGSSGGGGGGSVGGINSCSVSFGAPPYHDCKNQREVRKMILGGVRPALPASIPGCNSGAGSGGASSAAGGSAAALTCGMARELDPLLEAALRAAWAPTPEQRPSAQQMVDVLYRLWRRSLHDTIFETEFIVDERKIEEENFKLTVLQYGGGSGGGGGGGATAGSSGWGTPTSGSGGGSGRLSNVKSSSNALMTGSRLTVSGNGMARLSNPDVVGGDGDRALSSSLVADRSGSLLPCTTSPGGGAYYPGSQAGLVRSPNTMPDLHGIPSPSPAVGAGVGVGVGVGVGCTPKSRGADKAAQDTGGGGGGPGGGGLLGLLGFTPNRKSHGGDGRRSPPYLGSSPPSSMSGAAGGMGLGSAAVPAGSGRFQRGQQQQRFMRKPPSPEVIASLLLMRSEPRWSQLEDEGAYLVLTPSSPFYMLWATRKWTQLTGYLVNDVIAHEAQALLGAGPRSGPTANAAASLDYLLHLVAQQGSAQHIMTTVYRRDGKPLTLSLHLFPVYDSSHSSTTRASAAEHAGLPDHLLPVHMHMHVTSQQNSSSVSLANSRSQSQSHSEGGGPCVGGMSLLTGSHPGSIDGSRLSSAQRTRVHSVDSSPSSSGHAASAILAAAAAAPATSAAGIGICDTAVPGSISQQQKEQQRGLQQKQQQLHPQQPTPPTPAPSPMKPTFLSTAGGHNPLPSPDLSQLNSPALYDQSKQGTNVSLCNPSNHYNNLSPVNGVNPAAAPRSTTPVSLAMLNEKIGAGDKGGVDNGTCGGSGSAGVGGGVGRAAGWQQKERDRQAREREKELQQRQKRQDKEDEALHQGRRVAYIVAQFCSIY